VRPPIPAEPGEQGAERPVRPGDVVRLARTEELPLLIEIERSAMERFREAGLERVGELGSPAPAPFAQRLARGGLWVAVADDVVVGFAAATDEHGPARLDRIAVLQEHGRRGLGTLLVEEVLLWALRGGHRELALSAFAAAPWTRPFADRLGFVELPPRGDATSSTDPGAEDVGDGGPLVARLLLRRDLSHDTLVPWGWDDWFATRLATVVADPDDRLEPGRVVLESRGIHDVLTAAGPLAARIAGRLKRGQHDAIQPAIGDWVLVRLPERRAGHGRIEAVLERRSCFSRKVAGARTEQQVVAANVDRVFVVMGLDGDFNPRRLERFLITTHRSGARAVVVLNKSDLAPSLEQQVSAARAVAGATPVHVTAAKLEAGLDELRAYLVPAETIALVGSSGAGKSTLLNRLYGETIMRTRKVREADDRGRHTTTHRQLVRLPNGCLLIDNPGIRELQLWDSEEGVEEAFADIEELAGSCRFRDCDHAGEPGCAVAAAAARGDLDPARLASYRSYLAELKALERRQDEAARLAEKQRSKSIHKAMRKHKPRG
jgi:ribosome biogenesis GTPase